LSELTRWLNTISSCTIVALVFKCTNTALVVQKKMNIMARCFVGTGTNHGFTRKMTLMFFMYKKRHVSSYPDNSPLRGSIELILRF
jgi:hypothetical protein